MKIQIVSIADRGTAYQERLHLRVVESTNLGSYMVMNSVWVNDAAVANGSRAVYWFPPQDVKPNDDIVLYTRGGAPMQPQANANANGGTTYFYFWGQPNTLWNSPESCALLFDIASWIASPNQNALALYMSQLASGLPPQPQANSLAGYGVAGYYHPGVANTLLGDFKLPTKGGGEIGSDDDDSNPFGNY